MTILESKTLRHFAAPALALGLAIPLASSPALAGDETKIEVTSSSEMQTWKAGVSRQLDRALKGAPTRNSTIPGSGIVQIAFELDEDGDATNLKVYSNSADWRALRMAKKAVQRIDGFGDAPVTNVGEARFLANIIFADNRAQHAELAATLAQTERVRLASAATESEMIALGG